MNVDISGVTRRFGRHLAVAGVDLETGPGVFGLLARTARARPRCCG